jgi:hypothetical protein
VDLVIRALGGDWHEGCFCCKVSLSTYPHSPRRELRMLDQAD